MKMKTLMICGLAALALAVPKAGAFEFTGTTSGSGGTLGFNGSGSATVSGLSYTNGSFDVFNVGSQAFIGGTSSQNLGEFTLTTVNHNYNGTTFSMSVTFTAPPGAGSGTYSATISGAVSSHVGGIGVTWTTPTMTFTSSNGVIFTLTVNNVSVTAGNSSFVTGTINIVGFVPDGGSAVALLGIALTGIEAGRRLIRARKA